MPSAYEKLARQVTSVEDNFSLKREKKSYDLFTDAELIAARGSTLVFDVEGYCNYFLVAFKDIATGKVIWFEDSPDAEIDIPKLQWILFNFCLVGFNSRSFDLPLVTLAMKWWKAKDLKAVMNEIIANSLHPADFEKLYNIKLPAINHIDLIEVAPLKASLKLYGGRLHASRLQELDIEPSRTLTQNEANLVKLYCINDLEITALLFNNLKPHLELRNQLSAEYGQDLRSKSDAQIAECVICSELKRMNGYHPKKPTIEPGTKFKYNVPSFIKYESPQLQAMLETVRNATFVIQEDGTVPLPPEIDGMAITMGRCTYRMGIGGLHSSEKCVSHKATDEMLLLDRDVASYYPSVILNLGLFPKHLGKSFLSVYRGIVNRRLQAKRDGNKVVNESLKITINGTFGKLGNKYSALYSPDNGVIQVCVTGQLALLMLIEMVEKTGVEVLSANTDGILVSCHKDNYKYFVAMVVYWQQVTGFDTEETQYKAVYNRDVNNYIAIETNGKVKIKGAYAEIGSSGKSPLSKNPESLICNDAVIALLTKGTPVEETIKGCGDIRRFVNVRQVKGGAVKGNSYLGKAIRWYYSTNATGEINYRSNGNKVPKSEGAMPLMDIPAELPTDINYTYYISRAEEILHEIGYYGTPETQRDLFTRR